MQIHYEEIINSVEILSENCFKVDYEVARKLAMERRDIHVKANNGTERWSEDQYRADTIGIAGELAFSKFSGLNIDLEIHENGDKGVDFEFDFNEQKCIIDVKSFEQRVPNAKHSFKLYVSSHEIKRPANIYVLAKVTFPKVWLLGWETKKIMLESPQVQLNYLNYTRPQNMLKSMHILLGGIKSSIK